MSIDIGIIGLPQSGKTTIFNALTSGRVDTASHAPEGLAPHVGVARVPEPRLAALASVLRPQKVVSVEARYVDIGASVKGLAQDRGIGGQLLNQLSNVDALIAVVRAFIDDSIPHPEGSVDVGRDIVNLGLETAFSDLAIIERRQERLQVSLKGASSLERQESLREQEMLARFRAGLEKETPIRQLDLSPAETRIVTNYQFLTAKPLLIVVNIGEDQLGQAGTLETELNARFAADGCRVITLCGKLEMELAQLDEDAAREFRGGYGLDESGLERTIKMSYELLGLITFFTIASNEVKAWAIPRGTTAVKAAGKIHSDMERGFIRAERINYADLIECGSLTEARKRGLLRLEGKDYVVQDGDTITFLFNV